MIPWIAVVVMVIWAAIGGYVFRGLVDRRRENSGRHEFNAYSDEQMLAARETVAGVVRHRLANDLRNIAGSHIRELARMDREIARRAKRQKTETLMIEESKKDEHARLIAEFDSVYGMILNDTKKEKN